MNSRRTEGRTPRNPAYTQCSPLRCGGRPSAYRFGVQVYAYLYAYTSAYTQEPQYHAGVEGERTPQRTGVRGVRTATRCPVTVVGVPLLGDSTARPRKTKEEEAPRSKVVMMTCDDYRELTAEQRAAL